MEKCPADALYTRFDDYIQTVKDIQLNGRVVFSIGRIDFNSTASKRGTESTNFYNFRNISEGKGTGIVGFFENFTPNRDTDGGVISNEKYQSLQNFSFFGDSKSNLMCINLESDNATLQNIPGQITINRPKNDIPGQQNDWTQTNTKIWSLDGEVGIMADEQSIYGICSKKLAPLFENNNVENTRSYQWFKTNKHLQMYSNDNGYRNIQELLKAINTDPRIISELPDSIRVPLNTSRAEIIENLINNLDIRGPTPIFLRVGLLPRQIMLLQHLLNNIREVNIIAETRFKGLIANILNNRIQTNTKLDELLETYLLESRAPAPFPRDREPVSEERGRSSARGPPSLASDRSRSRDNVRLKEPGRGGRKSTRRRMRRRGGRKTTRRRMRRRGGRKTK